jgi:molecular chaperone DnaJ
MAKDYYEALGVSKNTSKEDIKKAYKRLAKKYHPNMNKGDKAAEEKFKEINEAFAVLNDDNARARYDQFGGDTEAFRRAGGFEGFDFSDLFGGGTDIFDMFFGGGRRRRRGGPQRGNDLQYSLKVDLEDIAFGAEKEIKVPRLANCPKCRGSGADSDSDIVSCDECNGTGYVRRSQRTPFGVFSTTTTCSKCRGSGQYIRKACTKCDGSGRVEHETKIKVKIPAGIEDGASLRIPSEGEAGVKGGPSGDLYVVIHTNKHKIFERSRNDIEMDAEIDVVTAALGGSIEVPTLEGKEAKLKIPAGTQSHTVFQMKGKGIPNLRGFGVGSQNVRIIVKTPTRLSKKQKELLQEFSGKKKKSGIWGVF